MGLNTLRYISVGKWDEKIDIYKIFDPKNILELNIK
jgi:hypothetical protein